VQDHASRKREGNFVLNRVGFMGSSSKLFEVLRALLLQLPSLLAIVACAIAAVIRWKRHPKVSLTVTVSMLLFLGVTVLFAFLFTFVPDLFIRQGNYRSIQTVITILSFFYNSTWAIALAILLGAIFMQRTSSD
jgi:hypothetical protein